MVRLNLGLANVRNCAEKNMFVKKCEKLCIKCKKKGILNLAYKQELLFEKSEDPDKFKEIYKKLE